LFRSSLTVIIFMRDASEHIAVVSIGERVAVTPPSRRRSSRSRSGRRPYPAAASLVLTQLASLISARRAAILDVQTVLTSA
jgi:hypothetical protein